MQTDEQLEEESQTTEKAPRDRVSAHAEKEPLTEAAPRTDAAPQTDPHVDENPTASLPEATPRTDAAPSSGADAEVDAKPVTPRPDADEGTVDSLPAADSLAEPSAQAEAEAPLTLTSAQEEDAPQPEVDGTTKREAPLESAGASPKRARKPKPRTRRTQTTARPHAAARAGTSAKEPDASVANSDAHASSVSDQTTPRRDAKAKPRPKPQQKGASVPKGSTGTVTPTVANKKPAHMLPKLKLPHLTLDPAHRTLLIKVAAVLVVIYVAGAVFFSSHFLPRTTVNGTDVSWASVSKVAEDSARKADDYELKLWDRGINLSVYGVDLDLSFDADTFAQAATGRIPKLLWPVMVFFPQDYHVTEGTTYDHDTLRKSVLADVRHANEDAVPTSNATVRYDEAVGAFVAVPESLGEQLDPDVVVAFAQESVGELQPKARISESCLVQATVHEDDPRFAKALEDANSLPMTPIDLRLSNVVAKTVDETLMSQWLKVSDDYKVVGNRDAIEEWTRGDLSLELDTVGKLRTFTRPDDYKQCQVYDGTYGWNIDGSELADLIASRIDERSGTPIEIPTTKRAAVFNPGGADWGNRYIDVDLTEQYARMFDETGMLIWSTECVTGNESENDGTVIGVYAIENKESPKTLIGLDGDGDGQPDYENDVDYWMPFYGGYGLHDAVWRDTFDYDTYLTDGSHGCVNLPYYSAALLYDLVRVGDPVVVHW